MRFVHSLLQTSFLFPSGFTVQMSQDDITGFEGDTLTSEVRLEGQLVGEVDIQLHLMTVSEFLSTPVAPPGFTVSDAAECMYRQHTYNIIWVGSYQSNSQLIIST